MTGSAGSLAAHHGAVWQRQFGRLLGGAVLFCLPPHPPRTYSICLGGLQSSLPVGTAFPPPSSLLKGKGAALISLVLGSLAWGVLAFGLRGNPQLGTCSKEVWRCHLIPSPILPPPQLFTHTPSCFSLKDDCRGLG